MIHLLAIISFFGALYALWEFVQSYKCKDWQTVEGIIIQSKLIDYGKKGTYKTPLIFYQYTINNKTYSSERIYSRLLKPMRLEQANVLLLKYPLDTKVMVSYHPIFKGLGVLETDIKKPKHFIWLALFFLFIFMISFLAITLYNAY